MAARIDYDDADDLLRRTWREVNDSDQSEYIDDYLIRQKIKEEVANETYGTKTFRYMLVTNVLAKAVNNDAHYLALKAKSDLAGSFNSGGLATEIVTDWEKDHGQRLGGSNEPRTNKPYFDQMKVAEDYDASQQGAYDTLRNILLKLQEETESGDLDPMDVLRQTLYEISCLDPKTVEYANPPNVPFHQLESAIREYLQKSNLGERLAAVTAGVIDAQYFFANKDDVVIKAEHVNVPDANSNAAGDIEVFRTGDEEELLRAVEVKDKPAKKSDIQHSIAAARRHELSEYLFVTGKGFPSEEERRRAFQASEEAPIELLILDDKDLISNLMFLGRAGRRRFREAVGEYLNEMRAQQDSKSDWKQLMESLNTD
jgi:hypothetical protein